MTRLILVFATALSCGCASLGVPGSKPPKATNGSLKPFGSERALKRTLADITQLRRNLEKAEREEQRAECRSWAKADNVVGVDCDNPLVETVTVTGMAAHGGDADTNTQHDGVDEGGLVKKAGNIVVVLRRGRLFTIDTSGNRLNLVDTEDLANNASEHGEWYDELLVRDQTVVVIGFSYARGGTEIILFDLTDRGDLDYRATYNLRSNDYYSSQNYASRLIGSRLFLFTSLGLPDDADRLEWLPAMRRWLPRGARSFERIASPNRVFMPAVPLGPYMTAHTLVSCDLDAPQFNCESSVVLGDPLSVYYASPSAAYAWTESWSREGERRRPVLYRMPLDGGAVTALQVDGSPSDQLAFLESDDAHLNVVVTAHDENDDAAATLLRVPLDLFADGSTSAQPSHYRSLSTEFGDWLVVRFVGEYVLVGAPTWDGSPQFQRVVVSPWRGTTIFTLALSHDVMRLDALGGDAIAIGVKERDLRMTAVRLGPEPSTAVTLTVENAMQSDRRSHAFLYRAEAARSGMFGLPINADDDAAADASRMVFVRNRDLDLSVMGALAAGESAADDDHCVVSCIDWYGNARPIFSGHRIFALIGYEMVEGRVSADGRLSEVRRISFAPRRVTP